jgi:hypothetical protein
MAPLSGRCQNSGGEILAAKRSTQSLDWLRLCTTAPPKKQDPGLVQEGTPSRIHRAVARFSSRRVPQSAAGKDFMGKKVIAIVIKPQAGFHRFEELLGARLRGSYRQPGAAQV